MTRPKRVALLSIDPVWADPSGDFVPFSYGVRKLEASIRSCPDLADVETRVIDLRRAGADEFFEEIVRFEATIVAASLFLWSIATFQDLARRIRAWDPTVRIVVGGPQARRSAFELAPYVEMRTLIDAAVTGDGEEIIRTLVRHQDDDWRKSPGLLVPSRLMGWQSTGPLERPVLDHYASPYQLGTAPRRSTGYLETYRGCPIHCAFCQWGEERSDRVHSMEYLVSHLEGLAEAEVPNVYTVDAGFNLSPRAFRNLKEAEKRVGILAKLPVHGHLYPTFATDELLDFLAGFGKPQVNIGIQSFDAEVSKRLGRPFDEARFFDVVGRMRSRGFTVDIEIMCGLPGDNPSSFRETFERTLEIADSVRVFKTLVLPDALLDRALPEHHIDFDPHTFMLRSCAGWAAEEIDDEFERVKAIALRHARPTVAPTWCGFAIDRGARTDASPIARALLDAAAARLRPGIEGVPGWELGAVHARGDALTFDLQAPSGPVVLEAVPHTERTKAFTHHDGVAYSYRGRSAPDLAGLSRVIELVHDEARKLVAASQGLGSA